MKLAFAVENYGNNYRVLRGYVGSLPDGAMVAVYKNNVGAYITEPQSNKEWADTPEEAGKALVRKVFQDMLDMKKVIEEVVLDFTTPIASYHNGKVAG